MGSSYLITSTSPPYFSLNRFALSQTRHCSGSSKEKPQFLGGRMDAGGERKEGLRHMLALWHSRWTKKQLRYILCTSLDAGWCASWDAWEEKKRFCIVLYSSKGLVLYWNAWNKEYLKEYLGSLTYSSDLQKVKSDKGHKVLIHTVFAVDTVCSVMQNLFVCPEQVSYHRWPF